jgi:hypothetical protein
MVDEEDDQTELWYDGEVFKFELDSEAIFDNEDVKHLKQIGDAIVVKRTIVKSAGYNCTNCKDFYQYAEVNQIDGTFKCWGCRH